MEDFMWYHVEGDSGWLPEKFNEKVIHVSDREKFRDQNLLSTKRGKSVATRYGFEVQLNQVMSETYLKHLRGVEKFSSLACLRGLELEEYF